MKKTENSKKNKIHLDDEELIELKKEFITNINKINIEQLKMHLNKIMKHCRMSEEGFVIIKNAKLSVTNKIGIIILARYIGSKLDDNISELVKTIEISKMTDLDSKNVAAHVSRLGKRKLLKKPEKGVYVINPLQIDEFLNSINTS